MMDRVTLITPADKSEAPYIVPKSSATSRIWNVAGEHDPQQMPPEDQPQPSDQEKQLLKKWIDEGAAFPIPERKPRAYQGEDEILGVIAADLQKIPLEHRRFTRYFTLLHL